MTYILSGVFNLFMLFIIVIMSTFLSIFMILDICFKGLIFSRSQAIFRSSFLNSIFNFILYDFYEYIYNTFFVYTNNHIYLTLIDIFNIKNDDEVIEEEEDVEDDNNKS